MKSEIGRAKRQYKDKLEGELGNNNLESTWDTMRTIIGTKENRIDV